MVRRLRFAGLFACSLWLLSLALYPPIRVRQSEGSVRVDTINWEWIYADRSLNAGTSTVAWDYLILAAALPGAALVFLLRWNPSQSPTR